MSDEGTVSYELRIEASPEIVFSYFTDADRMARWMGIEHELNPIPGGVFRVDVNAAAQCIGEFVEVDPPKRVVFTWGWRDDPVMPPGSTKVEVSLTDDGGATVLRIDHHGLPTGERRVQHEHGWRHFLARLEIAAAGGDPGPDPMGVVQR